VEDAARELPIKCTLCGGELFDSRNAVIHATGLSAFLGNNVTVLVCTLCGHLEWFLRGSIAAAFEGAVDTLQGEDLGPDDTSEPIPCMACEATIPAGLDRCPACGWSYKDPVSSGEH
jgi:hypothetical protein